MEYTTEELKILAKYPFLEEAKKYVERLNLTIERIGEHPVYSAALNLGKQRIMELLESRFKPQADEKTELELLILSYPIARILTNSAGNKILTARYSNAEANLAYEQLKNENKKTIERIKEDLKLKIEKKIGVIEYLNLAKRLIKEDTKWKLVNRTLDRGQVMLNEGEDLILTREAIRKKASEPIKFKTIPEEIKKTLNELKCVFTTTIEEPEVEFLDEKAIPKCISYIISLLQKDEANHNTRFILATFLLGLGLKQEEVLKIFSKSPKYDEDKTRYQIEFLAGQKSNTKYTCPACITIKSYGLCKADCKVKHPQQYYRNNMREEKREERRERKH
ncbi:MAG: hypothetical protein V1703_03160 [Candidatus Altiarchaeota archaeon]